MEKSNSVILKRERESNFNINNCIICQKPGDLVSKENGRRNIIDAANIRKDEVYKRLQLETLDGNFKYHMTNKCYKNYTHKKTLSKMAVRNCLFFFQFLR